MAVILTVTMALGGQQRQGTGDIYFYSASVAAMFAAVALYAHKRLRAKIHS